MILLSDNNRWLCKNTNKVKADLRLVGNEDALRRRLRN